MDIIWICIFISQRARRGTPCLRVRICVATQRAQRHAASVASAAAAPANKKPASRPVAFCTACAPRRARHARRAVWCSRETERERMHVNCQPSKKQKTLRTNSGRWEERGRTWTMSYSGYGRVTLEPSRLATGPATSEALANPALTSAATTGLSRPGGASACDSHAAVAAGASVTSPDTCGPSGRLSTFFKPGRRGKEGGCRQSH